MSIMSTMGIAQQSLNISEAAINVVSNNIANMNTPGYSREKVVLTPDINYTPLSSNLMGQAYSGSGVELGSVERYTDTYLQAYYRQQNSSLSYFDQYKTIASSIEEMTNELTDSSGIGAAFTNFYSAANTLNQNPTDQTARNAFVKNAETLASQFNQISTNLSDLQTSLVGKVNTDGTSEGLSSSKLANCVTEVNTLLESVTSVNKDIVRTSANGSAPNALLDKRDQLINQLSSYLPVTVTQNTNDTINVQINGVDVITGTDQKGSLQIDEGAGTVATPTVIKLIDKNNKYISNSLNSYIDSGSMGAILSVTGSDPTNLTVPNVIGELDNLAKGFADTLNDIQTKADSSGTPLCIDNTNQKLITATEKLFVTNDGTASITAGNISVNSKVISNSYLVAAAREDTSAATYKDTELGNNTNSTLILGTRSQKIASLGNSDPENYLSTFVGDVGIQAGAISTKYTNQNTVLTQAKNQLSSVTGVDLNEEIVDLTKYQRAYQASSRIFSICNSLLDTLVNLGK